MLLKTRAIVFRAVKYGETSLIVELFTEERGVHSFILSGVRSAKAKFSPALLQPMSVIEIVTYFKDNSEIHRIKELQSALVFQHIPFELKKGSVALFMAEICRKAIKESESDAFLFDFIVKTLGFLDNTKSPISNVHLFFMLHLSSALGFLPGGEATTVTPFFDLQEGVFCEIRPPHPFYLNEIESEMVFKLLHIPIDNCHEIDIPRPLRKSILGHLLQFYKLHLDQFGDVKTPDILEMVLAE